MKRFYFVRHGESVSNISDIHYGPQGPLSEEGIKQSEFLSKRLAAIPFDAILSSPFERAKQTAEIIAKPHPLTIQFVDLLGEKRHPTEMNGLAPDDPKRIEMDKEFALRLLDDSWRHSDDENWVDLRARAVQLLSHLESLPNERVLVVTHGWFLRVVIATMLFGQELTTKEAHTVWRFLKTRNTGVTICDFDPESTMNPWRMVTWNDHAHLPH